MIRRLTLQNWRAYENVTLDLEPGTTFVVARNGIGKSSLIEGATWALYGDAAGRPSDAVRLGSTTATASVELLLPDGRTLAVTRQLTRRLSRTARPPVSATIDGASIEEDILGILLREALGGDPAFLARITMVRGAERLDPDASKLNLQEHLARYFGADGLRQTMAELQQRLKDSDHRIRQVRQTAGTAAGQRAELRQQLHAVEEALVRAEQAHQAAAVAQASNSVNLSTLTVSHMCLTRSKTTRQENSTISVVGAASLRDDLPESARRWKNFTRRTGSARYAAARSRPRTQRAR